MAKVVYRGVPYDTNQRPNQQKREVKEHQLQWRGHDYTKKVEEVS